MPRLGSDSGIHILEQPVTRRLALQAAGAGGLAALAALIPGAVAWAQTPPSTPTGAAAFLIPWAQAWTNRDASAVAAFFAPNGTFEDLAFEVVAHGPAAIQAADSAYMQAVPDLQLPLKGGFAAGDWVAAEWGFSGTDEGGIIAGVPATHKHFDVRGVSIFQMQNGKILYETDYYNLATILRQLGLLQVSGKLATPVASPVS